MNPLWRRKLSGSCPARPVQVAIELSRLPPAEALILQRQLSGMRVAIFVIRAVPEQMRFDTGRIVVEAGQPFEIIFENPDFMPHNLVIVEPGARQTIGSIADRMSADQLDARGRSYVPGRSEVIGAAKMLEMGQSERLQVTAPDAEGVYEFVCTFPGHWSVMWSELIVTGDVEKYLAEQSNPGYPAVVDGPAHNH